MMNNPATSCLIRPFGILPPTLWMFLNSKMRVAFITDPWGTKMEITEGIAP